MIADGYFLFSPINESFFFGEFYLYEEEVTSKAAKVLNKFRNDVWKPQLKSKIIQSKANKLKRKKIVLFNGNPAESNVNFEFVVDIRHMVQNQIMDFIRFKYHQPCPNLIEFVKFVCRTIRKLNLKLLFEHYRRELLYSIGGIFSSSFFFCTTIGQISVGIGKANNTFINEIISHTHSNRLSNEQIQIEHGNRFN